MNILNNLNMKNIQYILTIAVFALLIGCETTELDLTTDPNNLSLDQVDANLLLNDIQTTFVGIYNGYNAPSRDLMRMENLFGTYFNLVDVNTLDNAGGEWAQSYQLFSNVNILSELNAASGGELPFHTGIAQVIQAYCYVMLVDYVENVPFMQANDPLNFPQPEVDLGSDIYAAMLTQLEDAVVNLETETANIPNDLYYGGDSSAWVRLANSLRLKMFLQTRLVNGPASTAGINSIVSDDNFISSPDQDFQFQYSSAEPPVDSRHPFFVGNYLVGGAATYMSNSYMFELLAGKSVVDPRLTHYIYRQTDTDPVDDFLPCDGSTIHDFCYIGDFYWGRDHTDNEGIPNDNTLRATYGVYPAGGAFDDGLGLSAANSSNLGGAGIVPIMLSSFTNFMLAESALTLGTTGNARDFLNAGLMDSFDKVSAFDAGNAIDSADITAYIDVVLAEYDAATTDDERLNIVITEYYLAAFGNGVEPYNAYRRTGFPNNLQSPILPSGTFPRSFPYPNIVVNNNFSVEQRAVTDQIFWDTNPADFID